MPAKLHHTAIVTRDIEAATRFYRDGIGLEVTMDFEFDGPWRDLFGANTDRLHSVFLGDPQDQSAGIVELVAFEGVHGPPPQALSSPAVGFFLISFYVDVEAVLSRLAELGHEPVSRVRMPAPGGTVTMATVRDVDGVMVELIGLPSS